MSPNVIWMHGIWRIPARGVGARQGCGPATRRSVRGALVASAAYAALLAGATPAHAEGLEGLLVGLNGIVTAPADPVVDAIRPPPDFDEVPGAPVSGHVLGIVSGTLQAAYRAGTGALDVALTPLWVIPTLSPEPRFAIIPGVKK